jgi:hypothetical protein
MVGHIGSCHGFEKTAAARRCAEEFRLGHGDVHELRALAVSAESMIPSAANLETESSGLTTPVPEKLAHPHGRKRLALQAPCLVVIDDAAIAA